MAQTVSQIASAANRFGNSNYSAPHNRCRELSCLATSIRFGGQRFQEARSRSGRTSSSSTNRGPRIRWGACTPKAARPWSDYLSLDDIERMASSAEAAFSDMENAFAGARAWNSPQGRTSAVDVSGVSSDVRIRVDSVETEEAYLFYADVPGVKIADVKVQARPERRELVISGERFPPADLEAGDQSCNASRRERRFGKFRRSFNLPEDANLSKLSASIRDGVLTIYVTRTGSTEPQVNNVPIEDWSANNQQNNARWSEY